MNKYIFIRTNKGETFPELAHEVEADDVEDAIRSAEYYPHNLDALVDLRGKDPGYTFEMFEQMVFAYYGLVEGKNPFDMGNGQDGTRTVIICVPSDPKIGYTCVFPNWCDGE